MNDHAPCEQCGTRVRIRRHKESTLAGDSHWDERICTDPDCPTNERPKTLATPAP